MIRVLVVNESTVLTHEQVAACVAALGAQVNEDFAPYYGTPITIEIAAAGTKPDPGVWELVFLDDSDQAGALGYHETTVNGDPIAYAFAKTAIANGESWTVTASHELLEMLADPEINSVIEQDNPDGSMTMYFKEVCDPCEDDSFGYRKAHFKLPEGSLVLLSDFVLPSYWQANSEGTAFDFTGHITKPLSLISGGYYSTLQIPSSIQWQQINDRKAGEKLQREVPQPLSRRDRHATPTSERKKSER